MICMLLFLDYWLRKTFKLLEVFIYIYIYNFLHFKTLASFFPTISKEGGNEKNGKDVSFLFSQLSQYLNLILYLLL